MNNEVQDNQITEKKMNFFKKVWYSIIKIELYPDMAAQGVGKAISYLMKVIAILAIVLGLGMMYQIYQMLNRGIDYLKNDFPEFSYSEGSLNINSEDVIRISEDDSVAGYTIIDTKTEDTKTIDSYLNEIEGYGSGIVVLKDKVMLKNSIAAGTVNYNYKELFDKVEVSSFNKNDIINYANSYKIINLYASVFLFVFVYSFIIYILTTFSNAIFLSVFGLLTTWLARIKMRYVAIFNMSVYALTLSIILNMIYIGINIFVEFDIQYFQVMYASVAAIYLVAAILILKSEFIKKQAELMKVMEVQEIVKKELEEQEQKEKQEDKDNSKKKEKNDEDKTDTKNKKEKNKNEEKSKKEQKGNGTDNEPEGLNA